jgi:glycosyltransferase involved in cell wall biosynthesis
MKLALVHDYLTQRGGAERVFELLCQHFPEADIFTSLYDPQKTIELGDRLVNTTFLQNIPYARSHFRLMAPFYYSAFRTLDLQRYDLIISSSTSFAKAVRKRPSATHICFCHNVTRFLWDTQTYLREYSDYQQFYPFIEKIFQLMRKADKRYAQEPDLYIANSSTVKQRIQHHYNKEAEVVNYPIDSTKFIFSDKKEDYCLVSSRMLGYKRIDVTIDAFNALGWPLIVIGDGPESARLAERAGPTVSILGHVSDARRAELMADAKYVIVSALEDYGLVPVEANASGTPVICYGKGGVLDTQVPGKTGLFFEQQHPESLQQVLLQAETIDWDYAVIREYALSKFSQAVFFNKIDTILADMGYVPVTTTERVPASSGAA